MTIYNYPEKENSIENSKYPVNNHLIFEVSSSLIYFVDSSNAKILLKTTDEGETVETVTTRTNKNIARAWHDRDNTIIYFVDCDFDNTISYIWSLNTSTEIVNEITSIPTDVFDIWIYDSDLWYYYYLTSYDLKAVIIDPNGDGGTSEWSSTAVDHYTEIDEGATPDTNKYISSTGSDDTDIIQFEDVDLSGFDATADIPNSQVHGIILKLYGKGGSITVDGNLTGMDEQTVTFDNDDYEWKNVIFSDLALSDANVDGLEITLNNTNPIISQSQLSDTLVVTSIAWNIINSSWYIDDGGTIEYNSSYVYQDSFTPGEPDFISDIFIIGNYLYVLELSSHVYVYIYNLSNNQYISTVDLTTDIGSHQLLGGDFDGTNYWIMADNGLHRFDNLWNWEAKIGVAGPISNPYSSMRYYNGSVYITDPVGRNLLEYDVSTLTLQNTFNLSASLSIYGIEIIGNYFYISDSDDYISKYNPFIGQYIATMRAQISYYGDSASDIEIKNYTDDASTTNNMGVDSGRQFNSSQIAIVGNQFWFLWKWSNENSELWKFDVSDDAFTEMEDCGSTTELPTINQNGIAYDDSNILSFVLGTGTAEVSTIVAQVPANIDDGDYINYSAISLDSDNEQSETDYYIWFDKVGDRSGDPAPADKTEILVDISAAADAQDVSDAIQSAIDAVDIITAANGAGASTTVALTCHYNGNTTNIADVDSGLTVATTTPGVDNTYYYHTYGITADSLTKKGENNIALMLNRNTDSSNDLPFNLEKAFNITNRYIYQISESKGNLYKIADLTTLVADGTIQAITDTYLIILRDDSTTELWKFQDMSDHIISAKIYHTERDYPTATIVYNQDEYFLGEGMFVQIVGNVRVNGSTSYGVRFEGYVRKPRDWNEYAVNLKIVDLENPAKYDLLKSYTGILSEGGGDDWLDSLISSFNYVTKGTFDAPTIDPLPTIYRDSDKVNLQFIDQLAVGNEFTYRIRPTGELDWTAGDDDSGLDYDQDTPIWNVETFKKEIKPNKIIVRGGFYEGVQIVSEADHGVDEEAQQTIGIIEEEFAFAWISTVALANLYADALLETIGATYTEIQFDVKDETNGFVPPAEEFTLAYTHKSITSAQWKINQVIFNDRIEVASYIVSSIVRWDVEDLKKYYENELADQVVQINDRTLVKTGWKSGVSYSDCTISFTDGTRTFTLTLVADSMEYFINGKKYTIESNQTVVIDDTEGVWYFYFDEDTLTASQTEWTIKDGDKAFVTFIYWDASANECLYLGWEFHNYEYSPANHAKDHLTIGTKFQSGFILTEASDQISLTDGICWDEDIEISVTDGASGLFVQNLRTPGSFPVWYRSSATNWRKYTATSDPIYDNSGVDNVHYNSYSAPNWSSTAASNTAKYICYWLALTNDIAEPIISIMGQTEHSTLNSARDELISDMDLSDSPWVYTEIKFLYKLIYKSEGSYQETEDFRVVQTPGGVYTSSESQVSNEAYSSTWDGVETIAPSKNAVYDVLSLENYLLYKDDDPNTYDIVETDISTDGAWHWLDLDDHVTVPTGAVGCIMRVYTRETAGNIINTSFRHTSQSNTRIAGSQYLYLPHATQELRMVRMIHVPLDSNNKFDYFVSALVEWARWNVVWWIMEH